jgi:type IV pilus assembly protein PilC
MPKFKYVATDPDGATVTGTVDGTTVEAATATLQERRLRVVSVEERRDWRRALLPTRSIKAVEVMHFSRQMGAFVAAGVPLLDAVGTISQETKNRTLRKTLAGMRQALEEGESFSAAAAAHRDVFPPFYVNVLLSAEVTGRLDIVLEQLARYIERDVEARQKIRSALAYPSVVVLLAIATVGVMTAFVLPRFTAFFESMNATLPAPTRAMIAVTNFLTDTWPILLGGVASLALLVVLLLRTRAGKLLRDRLLLRIPVMGAVVRYIVIERFCRILSSMVEAGVPLPDSLRLAGVGSGNLVFQEALTVARGQILEGQGMWGPLARTKLFPGAVTQMIRVGEETGTMDQQLEVMATFYGRQLEYRLKNLTTLFEPAAILAVGLVVGMVALALVSAMYGIYNQVNIA